MGKRDYMCIHWKIGDSVLRHARVQIDDRFARQFQRRYFMERHTMWQFRLGRFGMGDGPNLYGRGHQQPSGRLY